MKKLSLILWILQLVISVLFIVLFYRTGLFPGKYRIIAIAATVLMDLLPLILAANGKIGRGFGLALSIIFILVFAAGSYYLYRTDQMLDEITTVPQHSDTGVSVIVLADDPAQELQDTKDYTFGIQSTLDRDNTDTVVTELQGQFEQELKVKEYDALLKQIKGLYKGKVGVILMNESYRSLVKEEYEDFDTETRVLYTFTFDTEQVHKEVRDLTLTDGQDVINILISGIDTYGDIETESRSDVNIIASINLDTRQILLLTTPRDYYVELPLFDGCMDKLTHAGIYGIDVSMETLSNLYDIDIDYYMCINFTGFESIVDALGGVNVYSEQSFTSDDGFVYTQGYNELDGEEALSFVRERHAFETGDIQRGRDQMWMIRAILDKITSPSILVNYGSLMSSVSDCFETNISKEDIGELVQLQLDDESEWNVVSYNVDGTDSYGPVYSMGSTSVYIMIPDEATVDEAKSLLADVSAGRTLEEPESMEESDTEEPQW